ncbi:MAG: NADH oxidoreductase (quinone) subunit F [Candidatus Latescibacterota bacterium]|nr:MAG: NADH oxidoreductase (quinone) subunit F [Candidatus Latescibacterota bacterium]
MGNPESHTLRAAEAAGGYLASRKAFAMKPEEVVQIVKDSGLRGRGGAGFPTGLKWTFLPKERGTTYLCVNADESEPGTFKDRLILERDPHLLIEGILIACHAIRCEHAYLYIRGEFCLPYQRLRWATDEAYAAGLLGPNARGAGLSVDLTIHRGAGAYICGEETALLNSIEGKKGQPRIKPPFPTNAGLFGKPTVINNVETIANLPFILEKGVEAYRRVGTEKSPGTRLMSVSGHVERPGVYEVAHGIPMRALIEDLAGGIRGGRRLKALIPGGSSTPVLTAEEAYGVNVDFESVQAAGSMLGSGGCIVMDETTDMVWALDKLTHFYAHESCGQCTPCREGSGWIAEIVHRIAKGEGTVKDLAKLESLAEQIVGNTICVFSDALAMPVTSHVKKFRAEFEARLVDRAAAAAPTT